MFETSGIVTDMLACHVGEQARVTGVEIREAALSPVHAFDHLQRSNLRTY